MELKGTVIEVSSETGKKKESDENWVRYDVVINHEQGAYPKNAVMSFSGEKFSNVQTLVDAEIKVYFDIDSTKVNGKYYTRCKAYRWEKL